MNWFYFFKANFLPMRPVILADAMEAVEAPASMELTERGRLERLGGGTTT